MKRLSGLYILAGLCMTAQVGMSQGPLTPPGAPTPTMKTLTEVEPRGMIKSVPTVINQPGSYYFITNLTCFSSSDAIDIQVSDVTIDMRGFTLTGNGSSSGNGISCKQPDTKIFNGNVVGFSGSDPGSGGDAAGITISGNRSIIRYVKLQANDNGLIAGHNARIDSVSAVNNHGDGINCKDGSVLNGCRAKSNFNSGIKAGQGSTLTKCTAQDNGINGIHLTASTEEPESSAVIDKCTANFNLANGIFAESGANIVDCSVNGNGFLEAVGGIHGIYVTAAASITTPYSAGSIVRNCTANNNLGDGIRVVNDTQVIGNSCNGNGQVSKQGGAWAGIGIYGDNNRVVNNVTSSNLGTPDGNPPWSVVGIYVAGYKNRIEGNHSCDNATWAYLVVMTDNLIIRNSAYGKPQGVPDYSIVAGNHVGSIINPAASTAIPPNAGSGLGIGAGVTDTPWANFDD